MPRRDRLDRRFHGAGFLADDEERVSRRQERLPGSAFAYGIWQGKTYTRSADADRGLLMRTTFVTGVAVPKSMALKLALQKFGDGKGIFLRGDYYFVRAWIWWHAGEHIAR